MVARRKFGIGDDNNRDADMGDGQAQALLMGKDVSRDGVAAQVDIVPSAAEAALLCGVSQWRAEAPPLQNQKYGQNFKQSLMPHPKYPRR